MNIQQLKDDRANGMIISRETYTKLINAALIMEKELNVLAEVDSNYNHIADSALKQVKEL